MGRAQGKPYVVDAKLGLRERHADAFARVFPTPAGPTTNHHRGRRPPGPLRGLYFNGKRQMDITFELGPARSLQLHFSQEELDAPAGPDRQTTSLAIPFRARSRVADLLEVVCACATSGDYQNSAFSYDANREERPAAAQGGVASWKSARVSISDEGKPWGREITMYVFAGKESKTRPLPMSPQLAAQLAAALRG